MAPLWPPETAYNVMNLASSKLWKSHIPRLAEALTPMGEQVTIRFVRPVRSVPFIGPQHNTLDGFDATEGACHRNAELTPAYQNVGRRAFPVGCKRPHTRQPPPRTAQPLVRTALLSPFPCLLAHLLLEIRILLLLIRSQHRVDLLVAVLLDRLGLL